MTIAHVLYRVAQDYPGGREALARDMGLTYQSLTNKLNVNSTSSDWACKRELEMFLDFTNGHAAVAQYFAEKAGGVFVKLPDMPDMSDMALLDAFMEITSKLGALSSEFSRDYADGRIDTREFGRISDTIDDMQGQLLQFKAAIKRVTS